MDSIDQNFSSASHPTAKSNFPDFSEQGYQIERSLGHNKSGGRVTYLATTTKTQQPVVIKQFQFARVGASWSDYEAHEREIEMLQQLNSPSIPKYLDSFETTDGFCLVQEYKKAPSLAQGQNFTPQEIKQIAVAVLEVLVYLQQQVPTVIHRDIKPENLLVDSDRPHPQPLSHQGRGEQESSEIEVYLVDFGLARLGDGEVAASSVVKGTVGFMPPEQLFNRQLTEASDLYSLGATLICLLTKTKSTEIGNLIDETNRINFKHLLPKLNPQFIEWLSKMVAPSLKNRYPNAVAALNALKPIDVVGKATIPKSFERAAHRVSVTKVLLLSFSLVAAFYANSRMANVMKNHGHAVRQLRETGQCPKCNLRGADLSNVDLTSVDLRGADLRGADLRSSYLKSADLTNADLRGADLRGAYLESADLTAAKLRGAKLESADLRGAIMPAGFIYP